jgi:hypothetical protein
MSVRANIYQETVSGYLSGQIEKNVVVYIPPDQDNIAVPGTSTDRRPAQREIPTVTGIHNASDTIALSLQQGQQQLGLGVRWMDVKGQKLDFDYQDGEKRITLSPPKASCTPK